MNITFHYFVVKTLAHYAGIKEETAQKIAFYSQFVDNYSIIEKEKYYHINVESKPPEFFVQNNLAEEDGDTWIFYPATTAISIHEVISFDEKVRDEHCKYTITPFHFIPPKPLYEFKNDEPRENYRCIRADKRKDILINKIMDEFMKKEDKDPMEFGMLLHTYADTFAHQGYSGFWNEENKTEIQDVTDNTFSLEEKEDLNLIVENINKAIDLLPPVGHARALTLPDIFSLSYNLKFKIPQKEKSAYERNNSEEFLLCARNILDLLCDFNNKKHFDDKAWNNLAKKITRAEGNCANSLLSSLWLKNKCNNIKIPNILNLLKGQKELDAINDDKYFSRDDLIKLWHKEFENINYSYNPKDVLGIEIVKVENVDKESLREMQIAKDSLYDILSLDGRKARRYADTVYRLDDDFYKFNLIAYKHIKRITGNFRGLIKT